jgi:hypothetical protein
MTSEAEKQARLESKLREEEQAREVEKIKKELEEFDYLKKAVMISSTAEVIGYRSKLVDVELGTAELIQEAKRKIASLKEAVQGRKEAILSLLSRETTDEALAETEVELEEEILKEKEQGEAVTGQKQGYEHCLGLVNNMVERLDSLCHFSAKRAPLEENLRRGQKRLGGMAAGLRELLGVKTVPPYQGEEVLFLTQESLPVE